MFESSETAGQKQRNDLHVSFLRCPYQGRHPSTVLELLESSESRPLAPLRYSHNI